MAKIKELWEGLTETGHSGTYIMPHTGGYTFGRWSRCRVTGDYRFTRLGDRSTREACREGLEAYEKQIERRTKLLNKRGRRRD